MNDLTGYSLSHFFEAWALLHGGDWDRLRHVLNGAISMATRNGHELWCVLFRLLEAWFHNYTHAFAEAARSCTECADRAAALGHPLSQQISAILLGHALIGLGEHDRASVILHQVRDWQARERILMDWIWRVPLQFALSELYLTQGNTERARQEATLAVEAAARTSETTWRGLAKWYSARAELASGDLISAQEDLQQGLKITDEHRVPLAKWPLYALQYKLTGDEGVKSKALEITWQLVSPLDETDPAKTSLLASQRHSYLRINSDVHNVRRSAPLPSFSVNS